MLNMKHNLIIDKWKVMIQSWINTTSETHISICGVSKGRRKNGKNNNKAGGKVT
jgi:hypothetical protein